jgi:hypothetical protein
MKTRCEHPYRSMITAAGAMRRLPENATEWQVRRLASDLAHAVFDLDARMRAGLVAPRAWQVTAPGPDAHQADASDCAEHNNSPDDE